MSDEQATEKPTVPTGEQLRAHVAKVRGDYDNAAESEWVELAATAEAAIEAGRQRACGGDRDGIPKCTDAVQAECEWREASSCPRRIVAWEQREAAEQRRLRLVSSLVPKGLLIAALQPDESESVRIVREWLASGLRTLVLSGGVGIGKSTAAAVGIAMSAGSATYLHATAYNSVKFLDSDLAQRVRDTEFLVLDDVGLEHRGESGWAANQIQALLCDRHDRGARTVVTCNLDAAGFAAYGERVIDRLRGNGSFMRAGGKSLRVRK